MRVFRISLLLWAFIFCMIIVPCPAQNSMKGPIRTAGKQEPEQDKSKVWFLEFYQKVISPVDGENRCPMMPSCSDYAIEAFTDLPPHLAILKTFDRLLRCGHELYYYPVAEVNGRIRWIDPVDKQRDNVEENIEKMP